MSTIQILLSSVLGMAKVQEFSIFQMLFEMIDILMHEFLKYSAVCCLSECMYCILLSMYCMGPCCHDVSKTTNLLKPKLSLTDVAFLCFLC